ncbi:pyrroloquinoline quinone biosynthesis protein PqqB [Thiothrix lacustris]|uniref:pyrroloquinoline quinone biosynthesis protein PqqB n=1 Tax=Thiothrix lacustris TaxID=525917 RepID=UPI0027E583FA|nr:pyrroloquinoline quinone biosynthesis protein PqqB [Thiothrix lacustris]WMP19242.1 pyrroloquinoline quinone biosynthesis protein PqqB [Thiothrix lacustris]
MYTLVLGSAAGGGFPQWNCNCPMCAGERTGDIVARSRTQSSIAVSTDKVNWLLVNASPDIRTQLNANHALLQPARQLRDTGIVAVMLADSQIDHTTGLLILRESKQPLELYCTDSVYEDLTTGFPILNMLQHYCGVNRHALPLDGAGFSIPGLENLRITPVGLHSKAPPYSPHRHNPSIGDNVGFWFEDTATGGKLFYAPGLGEIEPHLQAFFANADCVLVDGTCWTDDEMLRRNVGTKPALAMGHLAQSGEGGMIEWLGNFPDTRKILIHINNTNPILEETSPERAELTAAGIEVSYDGMLLEL